MNQLADLPVSKILSKYGLRADKSLGQNFLTDPAILGRIVQVAGVSSQDTVLEVGAGLGHLTDQLAKSARRVIAVELDQRLIPALQDNLAGQRGVKIVQGDILQLSPEELMGAERFLVVANIPYYITSRIIRHLLDSAARPFRIVLTIQHEVARRICDQSGRLNLLALSVLMYGEPRLELRIPAGAFFPPPKVDSAVIRIDLHSQPRLPLQARELFFKLARGGFSHKRKTIRNAFLLSLGQPAATIDSLLEEGSIDPRRRAETLSIDEWVDLTNLYDKIQSS